MAQARNARAINQRGKTRSVTSSRDRENEVSQVNLVFICRENPRRSGISLFSDRPRLSRLMKTGDRRHPRSSGMVAHKSGKSEVFLFLRRVTDLCHSRRSFPKYEKKRTSATVLARYQSSKLLRFSSPPPPDQKNASESDECPAIYRQNLPGRSGNSEISDRPVFPDI